MIQWLEIKIKTYEKSVVNLCQFRLLSCSKISNEQPHQSYAFKLFFSAPLQFLLESHVQRQSVPGHNYHARTCGFALPVRASGINCDIYHILAEVKPIPHNLEMRVLTVLAHHIHLHQRRQCSEKSRNTPNICPCLLSPGWYFV